MIGRDKQRYFLRIFRIFCFIGIATLAIFFLKNPIAGDIEGEKYQRFYYHVLPVVLSNIHLDHPYDYSADESAREVVWSKAIEDPLNLTIERSIQELKSIDQSETDYFWMVDDRGFADFTFIAFRLFGEKMSSLSILWLIVFSLGIIFTTIVAWNSVGWLILNGLYVNLLVLMPGIFEENTVNGQTVMPNQHLTETRLFAIVAIPYFFTLLAILFKKILTLHNTVICTVSLFMLWWLNSIRSSIRLYLITFVLVALSFFVYKFAMSYRSKLFGKREVSSSFCLMVVGLVVLTFPNIAKAQIENDRYKEFGTRTTWHNYLMGYSYSESLSQDLKMTVSDHASLSLVIAFKESGDLEKAKTLLLLDRERLYNESQVALNWEPGTYDWVESERIAKNLSFEILRKYPAASLKLFLKEKPLAYATGLKQEIIYSSNIGLLSIKSIFQASSVFAVLMGILLHRVVSKKLVLRLLVACTLLFALSSLQTILFYISSSSFGETLIFIGMSFAVGSFLVGMTAGAILFNCFYKFKIFKRHK